MVLKLPFQAEHPSDIAPLSWNSLDRPNVPERKKPTAAQRRARLSNIRKAQTARRGRR
jgi:hypothetical protein